jgi:hypothetical protein
VILFQDAVERVSDLEVITRQDVLDAQAKFNDQLSALQTLLLQGQITWDAYISKSTEAKQVVDDLTKAFNLQGTAMGRAIDTAKELGIVTKDDLTAATQKAAQMQADLLTLLNKGQISANVYNQALSAINNELSKLSAFQAGVPFTTISPTGEVSTETPTFSVNLLPRQAGGPVLPGQAYLVGERGPEIFIPNVSGEILPGVGRTPINISVNLVVQGGSMDLHNDAWLREIARRMARHIETEIKELERRRAVL